MVDIAHKDPGVLHGRIPQVGGRAVVDGVQEERDGLRIGRDGDRVDVHPVGLAKDAGLLRGIAVPLLSVEQDREMGITALEAQPLPVQIDAVKIMCDGHVALRQGIEGDDRSLRGDPAAVHAGDLIEEGRLFRTAGGINDHDAQDDDDQG